MLNKVYSNYYTYDYCFIKLKQKVIFNKFSFQVVDLYCKKYSLRIMYNLYCLSLKLI